MTTKEYLQQIHKASEKIKRMERSRQQLRANLYSVKSISVSPDKIQSSTPDNELLRLIARVDEIEKGIIEIIKEQTELIRRISKEIEMVPSERYRTILQERYILCWKWEKIAVDIDIDIRHVYRLHGKALQEFERVVRKNK